jgi:L-threonylcarbamoyladenylate synthase
MQVMSQNRTIPEITEPVIGPGIAALRRGEVIVFPPETLYGLGADALAGAAVEKVFRLKGRNPNAPIPVLVADKAMLGQIVETVPPPAERLMQEFWPGPLTIVLPARANIPQPLVNSAGGIGVRISSHPVAAQLVRTLGRPLTATSANPTAQEPARTLLEAQNYFAGKATAFIDGGALTSRNGSTVVEVRGEQLKIIREGDITVARLVAVIGAGALV